MSDSSFQLGICATGFCQSPPKKAVLFLSLFWGMVISMEGGPDITDSYIDSVAKNNPMLLFSNGIALRWQEKLDEESMPVETKPDSYWGVAKIDMSGDERVRNEFIRDEHEASPVILSKVNLTPRLFRPGSSGSFLFGLKNPRDTRPLRIVINRPPPAPKPKWRR